MKSNVSNIDRMKEILFIEKIAKMIKWDRIEYDCNEEDWDMSEKKKKIVQLNRVH